MPHALIRMQSGRTDAQKASIAQAVTQAIVATAHCTEDAVSVAIEDVERRDWMATVYEPEIAGKAGTLFKKPGYGPG